MAAPSGTTWGSIVGDYGKIGLYIDKENTDTQTTVTVEVWFASKYSVSDSNNTLYYDIGYRKDGGQATTDKGSVPVSTSVSTGSVWSTTNQIKLKTYTATYTRANSTATKYIYAKLKDIDRVGGTMLVSTTTTIPGLDSYTVSYNANGGSSAPSSQTKYYGKNLTLSSSKPTRTGYTFQKWNTKSDGSGTSYDPGAVYSANSGTTLFAIWKANTYTITFNANGGYIPVTVNGTTTNNASITKTKTYGVNLSVPTATRTDYSFLGWATSKTATAATYTSSKPYTANAATTLYAVWSLAYQKPRVKIIGVYRGTWSATEYKFTASDDGKHINLVTDNITDKSITAMSAVIYDSNGTQVYKTSWTTFSVKEYVIQSYEFDPEKSYKIEYTVKDSGGSATATAIIPSVKYIIDIRKGGTGIAFGKTAEKENYVDTPWRYKSTHDDIAFEQSHPDTGVEVLFGIGSGGQNYGIYKRNGFNDWVLKFTEAGDMYFHPPSAGSFRAYYRPGDSQNVVVRTAGYVTDSKKSVQFLLPFNCPTVGVSSIAVTSVDGFILRSTSGYSHGSDGANAVYAVPTKITATKVSAGGLYIVATFDDVTNVSVNNTPIGIQASINMTFNK